MSISCPTHSALHGGCTFYGFGGLLWRKVVLFSMASWVLPKYPGAVPAFVRQFWNLPGSHHSLTEGPRMVMKIHSHSLRQPCLGGHNQHRPKQFLFHHAFHVSSHVAISHPPVFNQSRKYPRPFQCHCWLPVSSLPPDIQSLSPSFRGSSNTSSYIFSHNIWDLNSTIAELISLSHEAIINSLAASTLSTYWTAWNTVQNLPPHWKNSIRTFSSASVVLTLSPKTTLSSSSNEAKPTNWAAPYLFTNSK